MENLKTINNKYPNSFKLLLTLTLVVIMPLLVGALLQQQIVRQNAQVITPGPTIPAVISKPTLTISLYPSQLQKSHNLK